MERFSRSAYKRSMTNQKPKILFQHGKDPEIGEKPIATTDEVGEDATSPFVRGQILDGVPELVRSGLRADPPVYGASHRFSVVQETWDDKPIGGAHNPQKLPERTITEARLYELGPVTWPAYAGASVALRSMTDEYSPTLPVAPSDEPAASPHPVDEARDEPVTIAAPQQEEATNVADTQYYSLDEMGARVRELDAEIKRSAELPGLLPDKEQTEFDEKVAERAKLEHAMTSWRNRLSQVRELAAKDDHVESTFSPIASFARKTEADIFDTDAIDAKAKNLAHRGELYRDNAMRAAETTTFPHPATDVELSRDRIALILDHHDSADHQFAQRVVTTGSPIYKRAFNKLLLGQTLTPEEQRGTALAVGVDGTGGFSVPYAFDPTVIAIGIHTGAINPYRRACRVVPIVGTDTWNALTATVVTATRTTEAAPAIEQGPTFAQPQYIVTRVQAQVTYSFEMAQDRTDIASEMAALIAEAKDNEEENSMAVGTTAAANIGVLAAYGTSGAYTQMDTAGSTVLAAADALAVEAALPVRHRMTAQWFMNRKTIRAFQALETTGGQLFGGNGGYPAVGSDVTNAADGNTGLRLLGYPVNESPSAPVATTSHIIAAAFIAPSSYVIVERVGMTVRLIPDIINSSALATGQSAIYAIWRNTAKPLNVDAGRLLDYKT
jgi:HK97 family phage major capsid protein